MITGETSSRSSADESLATAISAIVAAADYGKTAVQQQPDGTGYRFDIGAIEPGTSAVYLNGLLQFAGTGEDYTEIAFPGTDGPLVGKTVAISFNYVPKNGSRLQVLGSVI
jgi:hypothetical protein